jgi:NADPH-dependent 2,4-dienoyl-CoA reductase/sulfur reductase-like enzyme
VSVIGAGLGGFRTVESLRTAGYSGRITLIGAESHLPYDRPPLSKQFLAGLWDLERICLAKQEALDMLKVDLRLGVSATAVKTGEIHLSDGSVLTTDATVIATGVVARRLPGQPDHVHTLRTLDDALKLKSELGSAASLLVVGAGFVGAEVASTAAAMGVSVSIIEAESAPFVRVLGRDGAGLCARILRENGINLRTGVSLSGFVDAPSGVKVELSDGSTIAADVGLVGIGGTVQLDWLGDLGLDVSRGVRCDGRGRVEGLEQVWAVGDVAAWFESEVSDHRRHEHWNSAVDQASIVANDIAGKAAGTIPVPYFWSDQFGLKVQVLGEPTKGDTTIQLHGEGLHGGEVKGTVIGHLRGDRLIAITGFGAARFVARYRLPVGEGANEQQTRELAASL